MRDLEQKEKELSERVRSVELIQTQAMASYVARYDTAALARELELQLQKGLEQHPHVLQDLRVADKQVDAASITAVAVFDHALTAWRNVKERELRRSERKKRKAGTEMQRPEKTGSVEREPEGQIENDTGFERRPTQQERKKGGDHPCIEGNVIEAQACCDGVEQQQQQPQKRECQRADVSRQSQWSRQELDQAMWACALP